MGYTLNFSAVWRSFDQLLWGLLLSLELAIGAILIGAVIGLVTAFGLISTSGWARRPAALYVTMIRNLPILVLILFSYFALPQMGVRLGKIESFVATLAIYSGAYLAEVFRAGLASVDHGQVEAAHTLGLNRWQRFRYIVFPQAIRTILPPLGNDFVAMVKDSSLVSVLGVGDITQLGKVTAAGNFRYFETYNVVALIYLTLTVTLSLALRRFERHMRQPGQD